MITQILKKEYDRLHDIYDHKCPWKKCRCERRSTMPFHIFKGADNKYYKSDLTGMAAVKESVEWNKKLKAQLDAQTSLI